MATPDPRLTAALKETLTGVFSGLKAGDKTDDVTVSEKLAIAAQEWFESEYPEAVHG